MLELSIDQSGVDKKALQSYQERLLPELQMMQAVVKAGSYEDERASLNLPDDKGVIDRVKQLVERFVPVDTLVLVGMGGPGLGAKAVQEAVTGQLHNYRATTKVFYADSLDPTRIAALGAIVESDLVAKRRVVVVVSTQSGSTTETIANASYFSSLLAEAGLAPQDHMLVITNEGSPLDRLAAEQGFEHLVVAPSVGGRYSVCSALGLFSSALLGIDIDRFLTGAKRMRDRCLTRDIIDNPAAIRASILHHQFVHGRGIHVDFLFAPELESLGLWYRELLAESLGKAKTRSGQLVHTGVTPTVAIGSRDLHATYQLYLEGPDDKVTTFVRIRGSEAASPTIPERSPFEGLVPSIAGTSYQRVNDAILDGVIVAYTEYGRPFTVMSLPNTGAETIGQVVQLHMIETMLLGHLFGVNPFDQPVVGSYKAVTSRLLAGHGPEG